MYYPKRKPRTASREREQKEYEEKFERDKAERIAKRRAMREEGSGGGVDSAQAKTKAAREATLSSPPKKDKSKSKRKRSSKCQSTILTKSPLNGRHPCDFRNFVVNPSRPIVNSPPSSPSPERERRSRSRGARLHPIIAHALLLRDSDNASPPSKKRKRQRCSPSSERERSETERSDSRKRRRASEPHGGAVRSSNDAQIIESDNEDDDCVVISRPRSPISDARDVSSGRSSGAVAHDGSQSIGIARSTENVPVSEQSETLAHTQSETFDESVPPPRYQSRSHSATRSRSPIRSRSATRSRSPTEGHRERTVDRSRTRSRSPVRTHSATSTGTGSQSAPTAPSVSPSQSTSRGDAAPRRNSMSGVEGNGATQDDSDSDCVLVESPHSEPPVLHPYNFPPLGSDASPRSCTYPNQRPSAASVSASVPPSTQVDPQAQTLTSPSSGANDCAMSEPSHRQRPVSYEHDRPTIGHGPPDAPHPHSAHHSPYPVASDSRPPPTHAQGPQNDDNDCMVVDSPHSEPVFHPYNLQVEAVGGEQPNASSSDASPTSRHPARQIFEYAHGDTPPRDFPFSSSQTQPDLSDSQMSEPSPNYRFRPRTSSTPTSPKTSEFQQGTRPDGFVRSGYQTARKRVQPPGDPGGPGEVIQLCQRFEFRVSAHCETKKRFSCSGYCVTFAEIVGFDWDV